MGHFAGRTYCGRERSGPAVVAGGNVTGSITLSPNQPTHDQIARLAYSYWEARGKQGGSAEADWLRAERELSARR